jgi:manganese efflux pump family protein
VLRLAALILPLALDTFTVSAAIGVTGIDKRQRLRLSLLFAAFEGLMPLVGFFIGARLGSVIGSEADYIAGGLLVLLGLFTLVSEDEDDELQAVSRMARAHGLALIGLGVSVSLDELAIGFSVGLLGISIGVAVVLIALQAFIVTQLGVRVGARVGDGIREGAERLAGVALLLLGAFVIGARLVG